MCATILNVFEMYFLGSVRNARMASGIHSCIDRHYRVRSSGHLHCDAVRVPQNS